VAVGWVSCGRWWWLASQVLWLYRSEKREQREEREQRANEKKREIFGRNERREKKNRKKYQLIWWVQN
jgi:hypothetical protein